MRCMRFWDGRDSAANCIPPSPPLMVFNNSNDPAHFPGGGNLPRKSYLCHLPWQGHFQNTCLFNPSKYSKSPTPSYSLSVKGLMPSTSATFRSSTLSLPTWQRYPCQRNILKQDIGRRESCVVHSMDEDIRRWCKGDLGLTAKRI